MVKYSKKAQDFIGKKMHKMKDEDRPKSQKIAIALSEARREGYEIPKKERFSKLKKIMRG